MKDILWWFLFPKVSNHISSTIAAFPSSMYPLSARSFTLLFPPLSSFYYQRHTNPLFHPSFSTPFRWKLDSHSFWQWHIAAACHHIPSTQHNVLADSPPLHLSFLLFIQPASTSSRWPPPSFPPPVPTIARLHHLIRLSLSGLLAS